MSVSVFGSTSLPMHASNIRGFAGIRMGSITIFGMCECYPHCCGWLLGCVCSVAKEILETKKKSGFCNTSELSQ